MAYEIGVLPATNVANDFILKVKTFLEANGWTITYFGTYNANNRLHVQKGGVYFCLWYSSNLVVNLNGHTAYDAGLAPTAQVGASATMALGLTASQDYLFTVFGDSFYHYTGQSSTLWLFGGFGIISDKIGDWTDGMFVTNSALAGVFGSQGASQSIRVNGAWTPNVSNTVLSAIGIVGNDTVLVNKMPCEFNAAILAVPVTLFRCNAQTYTLYHPLGFAPNIKRCNGGDVYVEKEIININGESWMIMPRSTRNNVSDAFLLRVA